MATYTLTGRLIDKETRKGLTGLRVQCWDRDSKIDDLMGESFSDDEGHFTIVCDDSVFSDKGRDRVPDVFVKIFIGQELIHTSVPVKNWNPEGNLLEIEMTAVKPPAKLEFLDVSGTVKADDNRPHINLKIVVVDKGIGKEKILGTVQSDASGKYRVEYNRTDLLNPDSGVANIVVRAYATKSTKKLLISSPMKQAARTHEIINLVIDRLDHPGQSLFDIVTMKFDSLNLDVNYSDLDTDDRLLIAIQTGLDHELVERFIDTKIIVQQTPDLAEQELVGAVFGMFLGNIAPTVDAFATSRDSALIEDLKQAQLENWIGKLQPEAVVESMRPIRAKLLAETSDNTIATLRTSGINDQQLQKVLNSYLKTDRTLVQVLQNLGNEGDLPITLATNARDALALQQFANGNNELVEALAADYGITRQFQLTRLTSSNWFEIVKKYFKSDIEQVEGNTQKEKTTNLATKLASSVEKAFPTAVFSQQWKDDSDLANSPVQIYLEKHPDFDFNSQTLEHYWDQSDNVPTNSSKPQLQRTERLFQLAPEYQRLPAFKAMWEAGFESAQDVLSRGRGRFKGDLQQYGIEAILANDIYRRAQRVSSREILSKQPVPVGAVDTSQDDNEVPARIEPTIAALFGAQGGNACTHCESAFSPGAYLVDLLRFLHRAETDNNLNGLDLFFLRRSDIANLRLNCDNTDTVMPYIDLVNEVLEHVVATSNTPFQVPLDWIVEPNLDLQTEATAEDLAAHPEHLNALAYNRLRSITSPWALPYNLWSDEVRTYLNQIGVDRSDLLAVLRADEDPFKVLEVASDRLNIDATEAIVVSLPADTDAKRLLIWQTADPVTDLQNLQLFLKRTDLSYEQAADIFATRFVNPQNNDILPTDLQDLESAILTLKPEDNDGLLDRFHRFTRLWRRTGWSTLELDSVMLNLVPTDLDENGLTNIGILAEIYHIYATPIEELASWFGDINTYGTDAQPALYQRNFLDGSVNGVVGDGEVDLLADVFALTGSGSSRNLIVTRPTSTHDKWLARESLTLPGVWELHPDYSPVVMAATKLNAEEMTSIIETQGFLPRRNKQVALNLSNLSQLYRIASIANALDISIDDYLSWRIIIGEPIGTSKNNEQEPYLTLMLMIGVSEQSTAGVDAKLLKYALLAEDVEDLSPSEDEITDLLDDIRSDLLKTEQEAGLDAPVAEDQLSLWFSLNSTLIVTDTQNDIATLIAIIDGSAPFDASFQSALDFLSPTSQNQLFVDNTIINVDERLFLAASEIPIDSNLLAKTNNLLREDILLVDEDIAELLRIFVLLSALSVVEQTELLTTQVPYLQPDELPAGSANDRLLVVSLALFEHWVRAPIVTQHLATSIGVSERHIELLGIAVADAQPSVIQLLLHPSFVEEQIAAIDLADLAVKRLYRQCALVQAVDMEASEVEFALLNASQTGIYDFRAPAAGQLLNWRSTVVLHDIDGVVRNTENDLYMLLQGIIDGDLDEVAAQTELADLFGVTITDLLQLTATDGLDITFPDSYLRIAGLKRLHQSCAFVNQMGVAAEQLLRIVEPVLNTEHASIARAAVRSKYDEQSWKQVSEQLRAGLRERQRDALLAFILSRGELDLSHEHAYAYYLIDMDMTACYQTTRLKQAIASVQQYVQRILLGLETGNLSFTKEDAIEWQWRKNYRVWEANVRIFIYPENWLVPELRDDKTHLFNAFEQELSQAEIDNPLAESAVTHYLEKLHQISNLEIVGLYEDDQDGYKLYVVARSHNTPHAYYHRTWNSEIWAPWEAIEMDIEGDHIVPVLYNNRLHIFWSTFIENVDEEALEESGIQDEIDIATERIGELEGSGGLIENATIVIADFQVLIDGLGSSDVEKAMIQSYENIIAIYESSVNEYNAELTILKLELGKLDAELLRETKNVSYQLVQLNWIVREQDGWSSKRVVKNLLTGPHGFTPSQYQFLGTTQGGGLTLQVVVGDFNFSNSSRETETVGLFIMSDCSGEMIMIHDDLPSPPPLEIFGSNSELAYTRHQIKMTDAGAQNSLVASGTMLLADSPESILYATKLHQVVYRATPFFLASSKRTFFVEMKPAGITIDDIFVPNGSKQVASLQTAKTSENLIIGNDDKYHFSSHYHPYTCACLRQIRRYGIAGLYSPDPDLQSGDDALDLLRQLTPTGANFDFDNSYLPDRDVVSGVPMDKIDFSFNSSYGQYNWEVFFHIPMMVATRLLQNRKFEQAQNWLHYIFDPTEKEGTDLQKYWKIKPFYYAQMWGDAQQDIDDYDALSLDSMIELWEQNPFQPFVIARFRIVAFMRATVTTYLDNLIAWGDSLFKLDTMESINEATQLYVLAASILGERPLVIDKPASGAQTFTVREFLLDQVPSISASGQTPATSGGIYGNGAQGILAVIEQFCLPYNNHTLDYWDTIADRLFKIRHCLNLDGVFRLLPVFQPPIDPALLVRAAAGGLDIGAVLSDLSMPRPHYRFRYVLQKASELISMVQGLGNQVLSALEKQDAELLALLRSEHEVALLKLGTSIRKDAIKEAKQQILAIETGKEIVQLRREFYAGRKYTNTAEILDIDLRFQALYFRTITQVAQAAVTPLEAIPSVTAGAAGISSPVALTTIPRSADAAKSGTQVLSFLADLTQTAAGMSQTIGQYDRRQEDWDHQVTLADAELKQFEKQLASAEIRLAMSENELVNHEKQIEQSEQNKAFIEDKFTNTELYSWMLSQLSGLYFQAYQLAYDMAKRSERCYQHELGISNTSFIQFGYWDSLKKGLLAGDKLQLDLKRLDVSYIDNNQRELELSKTVSLALLNPEALLRLIETGECFFSLPEQLFDLDYPGHYFRRIKNVSLTIPAITGAFTTVSCTLTLLSDRYRYETSTGENDVDFTWNVGSIQSIATSRGQGDSGLFELTFQDERYLPFERAGVISSWKLNLPKPDLAQFDYSTISDVLIQINYTARDGGQAHRTEVEDNLEASLNSLITQDAGFPLLMSLKNSFPDMWARMLQLDTSVSQTIEFTIDSAHLPYFLRNRVNSTKSLKLLTIPKDNAVLDFTGESVILNGDSSANILFANDPVIGLPMAFFTVSTNLGAQSLELSPSILQQLPEIKDLILINMFEVK